MFDVMGCARPQEVCVSNYGCCSKSSHGGLMEAKGTDSVSAFLHAKWQENFPSTNPGQTSRWKPAADDEGKPFSSEEDMLAGSAPSVPERFRPYYRTGAGAGGAPAFEADILHLPYEFLPPNLKKLNSQTAEFVVGLLKAEPGRELEYYSSRTHDFWIGQNQWILQKPDVTAQEQALFRPFAELPESEKIKDRAIVLVAMEALGVVTPVQPA